jgi:hypothetical protein
MLDSAAREKYLRFWFGAVAQLGERVVRNDEVRGSIPLGSTIFIAEFSLTAIRCANVSDRAG